jgi:hypothetical protein
MCPTIEPETTAWVAVLAFSSDHRGRMLLSRPGVGPASGENQPTPATRESAICQALRLWSVRPWGDEAGFFGLLMGGLPLWPRPG